MKKVIFKNKHGFVFNEIQDEDPTEKIKKELEDQERDGGIGITFEVFDISYDYALNECYQKRLAEYPTIQEFLDAYLDGNKSDMDALRAKRLEIKVKYPKP